ncbi:MAG: glycosyltransferase, partial [Ignavibacteriae bacterium]|nr:glycosyltransferase [Ignavibacteriota bacterium]
FKILNIGSIYPLKGQHVLIKVLSRLKDQNISVEFVGRIVDKEYFSEINKSVNNFVLSNVITFLGELNKKDLVKKILESDCIVITSKEEGQSLVILEALFIEKLIITTKVGITNEIIKNNFNGLLYDFNDVDTLCNLILKLKNDNIFYNFIKSNCKNTYIYNFNSEVTMEQYEKIISMS